MKNGRLLTTDCEGPISKNDNAFELTEYFIPDGDKFFALVSKYDDVLADVVKKPGYKAGDTLRLILPFLKAYGATNQGIEEYSAKNILLVPGARETLQFVRKNMPSFIVSTSYEQYLRALCNVTDFPYENVYCTELNIDKYKIDKKEADELKDLAREISEMQIMEIPKDASSISDFSQKDQEAIERLDEIFWDEIPRMDSGRMLEDVNPVGGHEKANAVEKIISRMKVGSYGVMYVGDSITDVQVFRKVRDKYGLTVSFNGNSYAIREADVAVLSGNTIVTSVLADVFGRLGANDTALFAEEWSREALDEYNVNEKLRKQMFELYPKDLPKVELITNENRERLAKESSAFRKTVRGEAIGKLG